MRPIKALVPLAAAVLVAACVTPDRGTFGPFQRSLNTKAHGYAVIADPTGAAPVPKIERFEVRPGDCGRNSGWNDCENDRERSELGERGKSTGPGQTWWYGWHLYVPEDYINVFPTKVALGQFHQHRSHVVWMFQNAGGGYHLDDQVRGKTSRYYELIPETELRGRWHRIEVQAKWSRESDGFLRVWVNGEQKVDYAGRTMTADFVYFKYGVYRSYVSRYKNATGSDAVPAQTALYANVRRSATRDGLLPPNPGIAD